MTFLLRFGGRAALAAMSSCVFVGCSLSGDADLRFGARSDGGVHAAADAGAWGPRPMEPPVAPLPEDAGVDRCERRDTMEPVVLYLSADDSNSMASPTIARSMLERTGSLPPASMLRTYEFLNYYNVPYAAPAEGHVAIVPELRRSVGDDTELTLQIGVQAAPRASAQARVITLVLDRSGSMSGAPIQRERDVVEAIAGSLREGDIVSWVEWNTERTVRLAGHVVRGPDDPRLLELARELAPDGGTDLDAGLRYGYELAQRYYDASRLNRVVLVSDGQANAGVTALELIDDHAEDAERDGIYLVGVGVGDGVNDTLMDAVTDAGRGAYVYVDSDDEAALLFGPRFAETMDVGLLAVRVEVTLPWYMAIREFHGEEYSVGEPERVRPQHLAPGDAMVFHQTIEACDASLIDEADPIRVRATYTRPDGRVEAEDVVETTLGTLLAAPDIGLVRGDAIVAYAEALSALASREADAPNRVTTARNLLTTALAGGANPDLAELPTLLDLAER